MRVLRAPKRSDKTPMRVLRAPKRADQTAMRVVRAPKRADKIPMRVLRAPERLDKTRISVLLTTVRVDSIGVSVLWTMEREDSTKITEHFATGRVHSIGTRLLWTMQREDSTKITEHFATERVDSVGMRLFWTMGQADQTGMTFLMTAHRADKTAATPHRLRWRARSLSCHARCAEQTDEVQQRLQSVGVDSHAHLLVQKDLADGEQQDDEPALAQGHDREDEALQRRLEGAVDQHHAEQPDHHPPGSRHQVGERPVERLAEPRFRRVVGGDDVQEDRGREDAADQHDPFRLRSDPFHGRVLGGGRYGPA